MAKYLCIYKSDRRNILGRSRGNIPVVIVRPTVATSTCKEPFPGWIQGFRTIDSVIAGYCRGKVTCIVANPTLVFDMGLKFFNKACGQYFQDVCVNYNRKLTLVMRLAQLYTPYLLFKGIFDDTNSEELQRVASEYYIDAKEFNFDSITINWEDYIMNTHIPGLRKHVMSKR
ncbi:hypothetical protein C1H46_002935 [Malus baccata]|uniref:Fatty acyl-CoA reductase C-terminal domain-containing protein n=1 Tax=Malus baccata TaxID=106549 RepID=A0A540NK04_MALBA|nr:hypothetical protein C1H46_002935 [Malus baccata]